MKSAETSIAVPARRLITLDGPRGVLVGIDENMLAVVVDVPCRAVRIERSAVNIIG